MSHKLHSFVWCLGYRDFMGSLSIRNIVLRPINCPHNFLSAARVMDSSCKEGLFGIFQTSASFPVNKTANLLNWISSAADYIVKWGLLWKKAIRDTLSLEKTKRAAPPEIPRYLSRVQVWRASCALHTNLAICRPVLAHFRIRCYLWARISLLPWIACLSMNGMAAVLLCPLLYL